VFAIYVSRVLRQIREILKMYEPGTVEIINNLSLGGIKTSKREFNG
jgi:hypothetical protein